jgi:hypothetical protein
MILYHTSDRVIRNPDNHYGRKNADFGEGFYLSPDRDFIYRWAKKDAVVNTYDLDETGLDIHLFHREASPLYGAVLQLSLVFNIVFDCFLRSVSN